MLFLFQELQGMRSFKLSNYIIGVCILLISTFSIAQSSTDPYIIVLGIAQDAGYPQAGCNKICCQAYHKGLEPAKMITCLGIVDPISNECWMVEASPDFPAQWKIMQDLSESKEQPDGILVSHAHIGHYTGLMHLGREAMGAKQVEVFCMSKMKHFLESNGPWSQLVKLNNIVLSEIEEEKVYALNTRISFSAITVPHRDEFSETVGFKINGGSKSILFIPDIDKWEKWDLDIIQAIAGVDHAFIDGTFYSNGELPNRDMSEIPHPFVEETVRLMDHLPSSEKNKINFIHFNHTNPLIFKQSKEKDALKAAGFNAAEIGDVIRI